MLILAQPSHHFGQSRTYLNMKQLALQALVTDYDAEMDHRGLLR